MIELNIPGRGLVQLDHLVSDVNGTLAVDGQLVEGVSKALLGLSDRLSIHLLTADTHAKQDEIDRRLGLHAERIAGADEVGSKAAFVRGLGADRVVAIGQGRNDAAMLQEATIGICLLSREGLAVEALKAADLLAPDILAALSLLENPMRLVASLRQ